MGGRPVGGEDRLRCSGGPIWGTAVVGLRGRWAQGRRGGLAGAAGAGRGRWFAKGEAFLRVVLLSLFSERALVRGEGAWGWGV